MSVIGSTNWQAVEALGVVGAAVVALALALWPAFRAHLRRPKLRLLVSGIEPHCVPIAGQGSIAAEVILRVEVQNFGKTAAREVIAKVTDMWIQDLPVTEVELNLGIPQHATYRWRLRHSEPLELRWAARRPVTIAAGSSEFVSVTRLRSQDLELTLCLDGYEGSHFKPKFDQSYGRHRLRLLVFADNCEPVSEVLEFVIDGKNFMGSVAFRTAPVDAQNTRLLGLLGELHNDDTEPHG